MAVLYRSALLLFLGLPVPYAQTVSGSIAGKALDPSGSPVPNAEAIAANEATAAQFRSVTDERGAFVINGLLPATYTISISKQAFVHSGKRGSCSQQESADPRARSNWNWARSRTPSP